MRKVLVVEDSSTMRGLIASIVDRIDDCEVTEVASGYEALRALPRDTYSLIITDINMPDINGLELISFIRKNPEYNSTRVLIVSSEGSDKDREKGLALGADAYITKPFEPDDLLKNINALLAEAS